MHADENKWHDGVLKVMVDVAGVLATLAVIASAFTYFGWSFWGWFVCPDAREQETAGLEIPRGGSADDADGSSACGGDHVIGTRVGRSRQTRRTVGGSDNNVASRVVGGAGRNGESNNGHTHAGDADANLHHIITDVSGTCGHLRSRREEIVEGNTVGGNDARSIFNVLFAVVATLYQLLRLQARRLIPFESDAGCLGNPPASRHQPLAQEARVRN